MKRITVWSVLALVFLSVAGSRLFPHSASANDSPFPLTKGASWVYAGITKTGGKGTDEVVEKNVTWRMEVLETIDRGNLTIAVVKGFPADLWWYEDARQRGDYLIVRVGGEKFYLIRGPRVQDVLKMIRDPNNELGGVVKEDELILELPLRVGKTFGETDQITRWDHMYCWWVESEEEVELKGIKGLSGQAKNHLYHLWFRTNPDHTVVDYVPGVGFTHYAAAHHGTVSEIDLSLVEFHAGKELAAPPH